MNDTEKASELWQDVETYNRQVVRRGNTSLRPRTKTIHAVRGRGLYLCYW